MKDIFRYTIVVNVTEEQVAKLVAQINKQVDVVRTFYHENHEIVYQEIALYKVPTSIFMGGDSLEELVRAHNARILSIETDYIIIEKTGHKKETDSLLRALEQFGIYEFVRSGRVSVSKPMEQLNTYLQSLEAENLN